MDKISVTIIFNSEQVTAHNVEGWFKDLVLFKPLKMRGKIITNNKSQAYDIGRFKKKLLEEVQSEDILNLSVEDNENRFSLTRGAYDSNISWVAFNIAYEFYEMNRALIMKHIDNFMIGHNGIVAYACSLEDEFWQDNEDIDYYIINGRSLDNIHTKSSSLFPDDVIVDTEFNPGHSHIVSGVWFGSCWRMWFGKNYYQYIPKEILLSYKSCFESIKISEDVLRITLYENVWDYDNQENRTIQKEFRDQIGLDEIAHELIQLEEEGDITNNNPSIEINSGLFEHGGVKQIIYYFNPDGAIVPKSNAKEMKTYELDQLGNVIWSEGKDIAEN